MKIPVPVAAFTAALFLSCFSAPVAAQSLPSSADIADNDVVATIGSSVIKGSDVREIIAGRAAFSELSEDERFDRMLESLVAEFQADYWFGRDLRRLPSEILESLDDARRQILLQVYAQAKFEVPVVTQSALDAYVNEHPHLFSERRSYQYLVVTIRGGDAEARMSTASDVFALAEDNPKALPDLNARLPEWNADEVTVILTPLWGTSEVVDEETRLNLDALRAEGGTVSQANKGDFISGVVLLGSAPLPLDPGALQDQIRQRIVAEAFEAHKQEVITVLAQQVLRPRGIQSDLFVDNPLAIEPPPPGTVVWSPTNVLSREARLAAFFALSFFAATMVSAVVVWLQMVRRQDTLLRSSLQYVPTLRKKGAAQVAAGAICLGGVAALIAGAWIAIPTYGVKWTLPLMVIGCAIAPWPFVLWSRQSVKFRARAMNKLSEVYSDEETARMNVILSEHPRQRFWVAVTALFLALLSCLLVLDISIELPV